MWAAIELHFQAAVRRKLKSTARLRMGPSDCALPAKIIGKSFRGDEKNNFEFSGTENLDGIKPTD